MAPANNLLKLYNTKNKKEWSILGAESKPFWHVSKIVYNLRSIRRHPHWFFINTLYMTENSTTYSIPGRYPQIFLRAPNFCLKKQLNFIKIIKVFIKIKILEKSYTILKYIL